MAEVIQMPKLSDTMTTGTLVRWLKKEGDKVSSGDMLAEVETDKATMEVENFVEGILLKRYIVEGAAVPIGGAICAIGQKGEAIPAVSDSEAPATQESSQAHSTPSASVPTSTVTQNSIQPSTSSQPTVAIPREGGRVKVSPLARKLADEKSIDIHALAGSGPGGRIIKNDVLSAASTTQGSTSHSGRSSFGLSNNQPIQQQQDVPVSNMRAIIARRLLESKTQIPHFYLEIEINADPLLQMREAINRSLRDVSEIKFTVNDFILKASAEALRRVPQVNVSWNGTHITHHAEVHLSFGVAVEDGLVTPVIRDAHAKGLREISLEAKELIHKARAKKLKPEEMSGSTFTVTNLGMYGVSTFFGIINPPNAAILSVGATLKKPVIDANNNITVGHRMMLGLSGDHRVIDGAIGAQFLSALKETLETPALMLF